MTRSLFILFTLILSMNCFSQLRVSPNILAAPFQGDRFNIKANNEIEGTPLLFDNWRSGKVILTNGEVYELEKLNFNASNLKFVYSINDTLYEIQDNVNQVRIYNDKNPADSASAMLFRNDMLPGQSHFVQVLVKGKVLILRKFSKKAEGENYSNGIINERKKYVLRTEDVALLNNKLIPVKYSYPSLEELTSDKKTEVDTYIKSNHLKPKKEYDFLEIVNFYNSLHQGS